MLFTNKKNSSPDPNKLQPRGGAVEMEARTVKEESWLAGEVGAHE
jgi:hypothetical protein